MKYLIIISILICRFSFPQVNDSTKTFKEVKKTSSIVDTSKAIPEDSLKHKAVIDTLIPIYQKPLDENSFFIPGNEIRKMDYRYTGDLLKAFDFNFTLDQGFVGQPNESTIYGTGFKGISYLEDGILINNRFTNSLDLNLVQTENIDSIEIVPLPRGFLYSPYNNDVTVNFITKDFLSRPPYSRIKYYQGPNGEALIDVFFNSWAYKRFNATFDISNRKIDSIYTNSSFSLWQARFKLKYLLSDKINIIGTYYYSTSQTGLNGGVDYAQIDSTIKDVKSSLYGSDINSVLYDPQLAPVIYRSRNEQTKMQNTSVKLLGKFSDDSQTNLTLYYRSSFDALTGSVDTNYFANTDRNKIYGASLRQELNTSNINLSVIGNYEKYDLNYDVLYRATPMQINYNSYVYSISAVATFNPGNKIFMPSIFYKASVNSYPLYNKNSSGVGADVRTSFFNSVSLYAGISFYNNQNGTETKNLEISGEFNNDFVSGELRYFSRGDYYKSAFPSAGTVPDLAYINSPLSVINILPSSEQNMNGIGGHLNFKFWKLIWENSAAHYYNADISDILLSSVPKYTYRGGLFYKNLLFHDNLDLKAGIVFYYTGQRRDISNSSYGPITVSPSNRFDFNLAGIIQKVAIVYFAWENLFNKQYYIVPYYPMPTRSIRFGIAWELFN